MLKLLGAGSLLVLSVTGAQAQSTVLNGGVAECVQTNLATKTPIAECLNGAMSLCYSHPIGDPLGQECFVQAKDEWGEQIKDLLASFSDRPDDFRETARIEAKYSVTRNLMSCARQLELSLIGREAVAEDEFTNAVCESRAVGVAYVELLFAAGVVERPQ